MGMSRFCKRAAAFAALLAFAAGVQAQDWKGKARIDGKVVNEKGEPIAKAKLAFKFKGKEGGPTTETDAKGRFAYYGFANGDWDVDVSAPGYVTFKSVIHLSELTRVPPMEIKLAAMPVAPPPGPDPGVPKDTKAEIISIIEHGNALLEQKDMPGPGGVRKSSRGGPGQPDHPEGHRAHVLRREETRPGDRHVEEGGRKGSGGQRHDPSAGEPAARKGNVEEGKALLDKVPPESIKDRAST